MSRRAKNKNNGLGRALQKQQNHKKGVRRNETGEIISVHTTDEPPSQESILTQNSFDALMEYTEMQGRQFEVIKQNAVIVTNDAFQVPEFDPTRTEAMEKHWNELTIPKRPAWAKETTKEELHENEKESFRIWRKSLLELEENQNLCITPFEKNIEVWRQLWRVVEKSQIIVQIVDARDPLFFRSLDLEKWVSSFDGKKNLLLINKSDLLSERQRRIWANFFNSQNIEFLFFSATIETAKNEERIQEEQEEEQEESSSTEDAEEIYPNRKTNTFQPEATEEAETEPEKEIEEPTKELNTKEADSEEPETEVKELNEKSDQPEPKSNGESDETTEKAEQIKENELEETKSVPQDSNKTEELGQAGLVGADELVKILTQLCEKQIKLNEEAGLTGNVYLCNNIIGMVGYPNVGKSSTINAIIGCKKVQVSQTPGKTKHFQTILLPNTPLTLCDCPGLVFPSFLSTKNEMYCNGLLRISEIRDIYGPVSLVCRKIPRVVLEHRYGISLPHPKEGEDPNRPPFAQELLDRHAYIRGFMNRHGQPDHQRSARTILNDYVSGKLLFSSPPPKISQDEYNPMEERLQLAGINSSNRVTENQSEITKEATADGIQDFQLSFDEITGATSPVGDDDESYMTRIKPHGRKVQRREKEKLALEQQAGAYTTGQRAKNARRAGPTAMLPTNVKVTSSKGQRTVTVLGITTTPGTASVTNQG